MFDRGDVLDVNIKNVEFSYGKTTALSGVTLEIKSGRIFGLIGPNGAGKTTLMKIMVGILKPDVGEVLFDSKTVSKEKFKMIVGYMPQEIALYDDLTVLENLHLFLAIYGKPKTKTEELLDTFNIRGVQNNYIYTLSEGFRRRVSMAVTMANNPDVIILDDPTTTIDPITRRDFWEYFKKLKRDGKTIILSTHILSEAEKCDEVALLHRGHVRASGAPAQIIENTKTKDLEEAFVKVLEVITY